MRIGSPGNVEQLEEIDQAVSQGDGQETACLLVDHTE